MNILCPGCGKSLEIPDVQALDRQGQCPTCGAALFGPSTHTYATGNPPPPPTDVLRSGEILGGYVVERMIGRGGMGSVYLAVQQSLGRKVALKVLGEEYAKDPAFVARFDREASALANLSHPNIVGIHDKGVSNGRYYLVMEYVDGVSLRDVLAKKTLDPAQALRIVPSLCEALEYAHSQGIVHRDIKPENLLMTKSGQVKIADFGLARLTQGEQPAITQTHQVMGTRDYMAPEARLSAKNSDHRADIYSLGVVLYEMLTGELPIGKFAAPSKKVQIDVRLDEVVLKTLEADPGMRYQRAGEVGRDVTRITGTPSQFAAPVAPGRPRLTVRKEGKLLGGVFSGIAHRYGWEAIWLRLGFVLLCLLPTLGLKFGGGDTPTVKLELGFFAVCSLSYLFLWIFLPKEGEAPLAAASPRLVRPSQGGMVAGVCAGIAQRHGWEPVLVRLAFLILSLLTCGTGLIAYLFCWIAIPKEGATGSRSVIKVLLLGLLGLVMFVVLGILCAVFFAGSLPESLKENLVSHAIKNSKRGVRVKSVLPGGQAERLGIRSGDVFLLYDGRFPNNLEGLQNRIEEAKGRKDIPLMLFRDGVGAKAFKVEGGPLGIEAEGIGPSTRGERQEEAPVAAAQVVRLHSAVLHREKFLCDLRAGDRVLSFNGKPVYDAATLLALFQQAPEGRDLPVVVEREGKEIHVPAGRNDLIHFSLGQASDPARVAKVRLGLVLPEGMAGLKTGDRVLSYNGCPVDSPVHLSGLTISKAPTDLIPMILLREGKEIHLLVPGGPLNISVKAVKD